MDTRILPCALPSSSGQELRARHFPGTPWFPPEASAWRGREPWGRCDGYAGLGSRGPACKVPPWVQMPRSVDRAYKFFLLLLIMWKVTADDCKSHNFCLLTLRSCSGSPYKLLRENKSSRRESAVNWHPNVIIHFAPCVRGGCIIVWLMPSSYQAVEQQFGA